MATATNQLPSSEDLPGRISVLYSSEIKSLDQFVAHTKKQWIRIKDLQALPASEQCRHIILVRVEVEDKYDLTDIRKTKTWMSFRVKEVAPMPRFEKAISDLPVSLAIQNRAGLVAQERIDKGDILAIVSPLICSSPKPNSAFDLYTHDCTYVFVWKQGNRTSASANAKVPVFKPPWPEPTRRNGDLYHYSSLYDCAQRLNDKRNHFYALVTGILRPPSQGRASHSSWHAMYAIVDETCHMPLMEGTEEYEQWINSPKPQPKDYVFHIFEKGGKDAFPPIIVGDVIRVHRAIAERRQSRSGQITNEIPQSSADFRTFSGSSIVIFRRNEPPVSTGTGYSFTDEERRLAIKMLDFSEMYMQVKDKAYKVRTFAELSDLAAEPETLVNLAGRLVLLKAFFENGKLSSLIYLEDGTFCNLPLEKLTLDVTDSVRPNQRTPSHFPVVKINVPLLKKTFDDDVGTYLIFRGVLMKKSRQADYEYYSFDLRGVGYSLSSCSQLRTTIAERIANSEQIVEEDSEEIWSTTISQPMEGASAGGVRLIYPQERAPEVRVVDAAADLHNSQQHNQRAMAEHTVAGPSSLARTESPEVKLLWDSNAERAPNLKIEFFHQEQPTPYLVTECSSVAQPVTHNGNDQEEDMDISGIVDAILSSKTNHELPLANKIKLEGPITTPSPVMDQDLSNGNSSPSITGRNNLELSLSVHSGEESDPDLFDRSPNLRNGLRTDVNLAQVVSVGTVTSMNTPSSIYCTPAEGPSQIASLRCAPGPSCENPTVQTVRDGAIIPIRVTFKMNEDEIELDECDSKSEEELSLRLSPANRSSLKRAYTFRHIEATRGKRLAKDSDLNGQRDSNHTAMAAGVHAYEERRRDQMERNVSKVFLKGLVRELDLDPAYSFEDLKQGGRKAKIIGIELDERLGEMSVHDILSEWVFGICSSCCRAYSYTLFRTFTSDSCVRRDVIPSFPRNVLSRMVLNNFSDGSANAGDDEVQQSPRFTCRLYHCPQCIAGNVEFTECYLVPTFLTTLQLNDEHGQNLELFLGGLSAEYFFGVCVNAFLHKTTAQERFMANLRKIAGQKVHVAVEVTVDNEGQQKLQIVGTKNEF